MEFRNFSNCGGIHPAAYVRYQTLPSMERVRARNPVVAHSLGLLGKVPLFPPFKIHVAVIPGDPRCMFTIYPNESNWEELLVRQCEEVLGSRGISVVYNGTRIGNISMVNIWNSRDTTQYSIVSSNEVMRASSSQATVVSMSDDYLKQMIDEIHKRVVANIINQLETLDAPSITNACRLDNVKRATHAVVVSQSHPVDNCPYTTVIGKCGVTMMDDFITRISQNVCNAMHSVACGVQNAKCAITKKIIMKRAKSNLRSCRFHEWLCSIKARWQHRMECLKAWTQDMMLPPCPVALPVRQPCVKDGYTSSSSSSSDDENGVYYTKRREPCYDSWSHRVHSTVLLGAPYTTIDARFGITAMLHESPIAELWVAPGSAVKSLDPTVPEIDPLTSLMNISKKSHRAVFGDIAFLVLKPTSMTRKTTARDILGGSKLKTVAKNVFKNKSFAGATKTQDTVRIDVSHKTKDGWKLITSTQVKPSEDRKVLAASLCVPIIDTSYLFAVYIRPEESKDDSWVYSGSTELTLKPKMKVLKEAPSVSTKSLLAQLDKYRSDFSVTMQDDLVDNYRFIYPFMVSPLPLKRKESSVNVIFSGPRSVEKLTGKNYLEYVSRWAADIPRTMFYNGYLPKAKYILMAAKNLHTHVVKKTSGLIDVKTGDEELHEGAARLEKLIASPIGSMEPNDFLTRLQESNRMAASSEGFSYAKHRGTLIGEHMTSTESGMSLLKKLEEVNMKFMAKILAKYLTNLPTVMFHDGIHSKEAGWMTLVESGDFVVYLDKQRSTLHTTSSILSKNEGKNNLVNAILYYIYSRSWTRRDEIIKALTTDFSVKNLFNNYLLGSVILNPKDPALTAEQKTNLLKQIESVSSSTVPKIAEGVSQIIEKVNLNQ